MMWTEDLKGSIDFYINILGFTADEVSEEWGWATLTIDDFANNARQTERAYAVRKDRLYRFFLFHNGRCGCSLGETEGQSTDLLRHRKLPLWHARVCRVR